MNKLNLARALVRLIERSPDTGDGWRDVSPKLANIIEEKARITPELFEFRSRSDGLLSQIRLSEHGFIVGKYL